MNLVEDYHGTHDGRAQIDHGDGPLPEGRSGIPSYLRSYIVELGRLCDRPAPVVQTSGNWEQQVTKTPLIWRLTFNSNVVTAAPELLHQAQSGIWLRCTNFHGWSTASDAWTPMKSSSSPVQCFTSGCFQLQPTFKIFDLGLCRKSERNL